VSSDEEVLSRDEQAADFALKPSVCALLGTDEEREWVDSARVARRQQSRDMKTCEYESNA